MTTKKENRLQHEKRKFRKQRLKNKVVIRDFLVPPIHPDIELFRLVTKNSDESNKDKIQEQKNDSMKEKNDWLS